MRIALFVLLAVAVIEAAALAAVILLLVRQKREARELLPVDVLPIFFAEQRQTDGWDVIDDVIQFDDDQRAAYYRKGAESYGL